MRWEHPAVETRNSRKMRRWNKSRKRRKKKKACQSINQENANINKDEISSSTYQTDKREKVLYHRVLARN